MSTYKADGTINGQPAEEHTTTSITAFANLATNHAHKKALSHMAASADALISDIESMPEWARSSHCKAFGVSSPVDTRVSVGSKVDHDRLDVDQWVSKGGMPMHRVHWSDGTATEFCGDLSRHFVVWDR